MSIEFSTLKVLAYFDLFHYPITEPEIEQFLDQQVNHAQLTSALNNLVHSGRIFQFEEFYSIRNDYELVERRKLGNQKAVGLLQTAYRISSQLYKFPFVRGVAISGSLSKNFADENADIDYFIITKSNRLWIARTLMHLYKKLAFLRGRQHWFCMNYFIDENALGIQEKNLFTATEIVTLKPVCGNGTLKGFFSANNWTSNFYPNYCVETESRRPSKHSKIKKLIERIFDNKIGNRLDDYLLHLTTKRWKQKELKLKLNMKGNLMAIRTNKHFSTPRPEVFQDKLLKTYKEKLESLKQVQQFSMEQVRV